jgi:hypothetical protein
VALLDVPVASAPQLWNIFSNTEQPLRIETRTYAGTAPGQLLTRSRLYASRQVDVLHSRIALIPFRIGEEIPAIRWDAQANRATLQWRDQKDALDFSLDAGRTHVKVLRDGAEILAGK